MPKVISQVFHFKAAESYVFLKNLKINILSQERKIENLRDQKYPPEKFHSSHQSFDLKQKKNLPDNNLTNFSRSKMHLLILEPFQARRIFRSLTICQMSYLVYMHDLTYTLYSVCIVSIAKATTISIRKFFFSQTWREQYFH